jgi:protein SCO1
MSKPQKILTIVLWTLAVGGMVGLVAMKTIPAGTQQMPTTEPSPAAAQIIADPVNSTDVELPDLYPAPSFTLLDQDGKNTSETQLLGHPWVADFIFTTCASLCPRMSGEMEHLQGELPSDVKLVSFSVDPKNDTPPVLKAYADEHHAQPNRWIFLTGDEKTQERVVRAMKLGFAPASAGVPIQHDEHFVLIDSHGNIRGFYDSFVPDQMDELVRDATSLTENPSGAGQ